MFPSPTAKPRQERRNSMGLSQLPRFSSTDEFSLKSSSGMSFKVSLWARHACACKQLSFTKNQYFSCKNFRWGQEWVLDNGWKGGRNLLEKFLSLFSWHGDSPICWLVREEDDYIDWGSVYYWELDITFHYITLQLTLQLILQLTLHCTMRKL